MDPELQDGLRLPPGIYRAHICWIIPCPSYHHHHSNSRRQHLEPGLNSPSSPSPPAPLLPSPFTPHKQAEHLHLASVYSPPLAFHAENKGKCLGTRGQVSWPFSPSLHFSPFLYPQSTLRLQEPFCSLHHVCRFFLTQVTILAVLSTWSHHHALPIFPQLPMT